MFRQTKLFHYPNSLSGWIVFTLLVIFLVNIFSAVDRNAHSVSDTLYGIFPYYASAFLLYEWFAARNSK